MNNGTIHWHDGAGSVWGAVGWLVGRPLIGLALFGIAAVSVALLASSYYVYAFVPALALLATLLLYRYPAIGFFTVVFLIPFGGMRRIEGQGTAGQGGVSFNIPWLVAGIVMLTLLVQLFPAKSIPARLRSNLWPWLIAWFLVSMVSAGMSPFKATAAQNVALLAAAYLFVGLAMILLTPALLRRALPIVVAGSVSLSAFLAALGLFLHIPLFAEKQGEVLMRGIGGAIDPNNLSLMILYAVPLVIYGAIWSERWSVRLLCLALLVVDMMGVVSTYSRGAALMSLVTLVLLLFEHRRRLNPTNVGVMTSTAWLLLVTIVLLIPISYWQRQESLLAWKDYSLRRRSSYLVVGWNSSLEDPVLGTGPGTFRDLYARSEIANLYLKKGMTQRRFAHNTYLEILVGTGLVGLALFLAVLVRAFLNFSGAIRTLEARERLADAALVRTYRVSFLVVAAYLLVFSEQYHKDLLLSLALSQAVIWLARGTEEEEESWRTASRSLP